MRSVPLAADKVDVVVVGAGWNGLISAKTYLDINPTADLVILDKQESIGGVWSAEKIYPNLYAQIKHGQFEFSFYPMCKEGITEDGYISGETIHRYLNDFASDFDLVRRTRLLTTVQNVHRAATGGWRLHIAGKAPIECAKLIYASGATSHPFIPSYPRNNFNSPVIHSSETGTHLRELDMIKSATVIGGAKSSFDTVFLLLKSGKQVHWIIREDGSGPLALMPPALLGIASTMDVVATKFVAMMGLSIMNTDGMGRQFLQRTFCGRLVRRLFWKTVNAIADRHAGYSKSENAQKLRPEPHGDGIFWASAGLGAASVPLFWQTFHSGDCTVHRTDVESLSDNDLLVLKDETRFRTDYVILCTGFDKSFHVFDEKLQQECGFIPDLMESKKWAKLDADADQAVAELLPDLNRDHNRLDTIEPLLSSGGQKLLHGPTRHYRRLVVPSFAAEGDRSIYFPGFIHTEVQALWGVAFLLGFHDTPTRAEMEQEMAEWNAWSRKRYKIQGRKHAYAIYDFLPYIETLLRDLNISIKHNRSWFANLFMPTYPRDYKDVISEFLSQLAEKQMLLNGSQVKACGQGGSDSP